MSKRFDRMYSSVGRPSIPPERLLKAQILIAQYSVRSDRMFCEQLDYKLLFRWFLDMNADDPAFDHSTFTKNGDRRNTRCRSCRGCCPTGGFSSTSSTPSDAMATSITRPCG
jgi:transposase